MIRSGVLNDDHAKKSYEPMTYLANERHLGVPHLEKTTRLTKDRKFGYRYTPRPRAPRLAHIEHAQFLNPINPHPHVEVFGQAVTTAHAPSPTPTFRGVVEKFDIYHPSFATHRGMLPENAYFLQKLQLDPVLYYTQSNQHGKMHPSPLKMGRALPYLYEQVYKSNPAQGVELESLYEETMRHLMDEAKVKVSDDASVKSDDDDAFGPFQTASGDSKKSSGDASASSAQSGSTSGDPFLSLLHSIGYAHAPV
ncbi:MAG: hypothetical protein GWP50_05565 [Proteobacteria bacterium]|nr:hypothetical protein [Pseudomonadota bacterium]